MQSPARQEVVEVGVNIFIYDSQEEIDIFERTEKISLIRSETNEINEFILAEKIISNGLFVTHIKRHSA